MNQIEYKTLTHGTNIDTWHNVDLTHGRYS